MNVGHIEGGTNASWRRVKPKGKDWECDCGPQRGYLVRCSKCWKERPDGGS